MLVKFPKALSEWTPTFYEAIALNGEFVETHGEENSPRVSLKFGSTLYLPWVPVATPPQQLGRIFG